MFDRVTTCRHFFPLEFNGTEASVLPLTAATAMSRPSPEVVADAVANVSLTGDARSQALRALRGWNMDTSESMVRLYLGCKSLVPRVTASMLNDMKTKLNFEYGFQALLI